MTITNGVYTNGQVGAQQLRARLDDPQTAQALNQLLDNAELLALTVTALDGFLRRGDTIADNVSHSIAELKASVPPVDRAVTDQLPQLVAVLPQLLSLTTQLATITSTPAFQQLLALLSDGKTVGALTQLMANMELIAFAVNALDGFLQRSETITENVVAGIAEARQSIPTEDLAMLAENLPKAAKLLPQALESAPQLVESLPQIVENLPQLVETMPNLLGLAQKLEPVLNSPEFDSLMNSGVLDPKTLTIVGQAGNALVETMDSGPSGVGFFGLLGALGDPDVQKGIGFALEFARRFGRKLG